LSGGGGAEGYNSVIVDERIIVDTARRLQVRGHTLLTSNEGERGDLVATRGGGGCDALSSCCGGVVVWGGVVMGFSVAFEVVVLIILTAGL
jgi:hypothetical protein